MEKYLTGEEPAVGDVFVHPGYEVSEWTVARFDGEHWRCKESDCIASISRAKLLRRAPSSPAPTPTEGERFAVGAVWLSTSPAYSHAMRSERGWYLHYNGDDPDMRRLTPCGDQPNEWASRNATYAGNLSAVFAGLVRLHEAPITFGGKRVVVDPSVPRGQVQFRPEPLVDAEELAAREREKHKREAAALQERYRTFHETVTRVVHDEAPGARVVTDFGLCDAFGTPSFYAWVEHCGLKDVVRIDQTEPVSEAAKRASYVVRSFRDELGSRLLKGGGK